MITKPQLDGCNTMQDMQELLSKSSIDDLQEYLDAVEPARKFVGLTMRDEYILDQVRRAYDKMVGNIANHPNGPT